MLIVKSKWYNICAKVLIIRNKKIFTKSHCAIMLGILLSGSALSHFSLSDSAPIDCRAPPGSCSHGSALAEYMVVAFL